MNSSLDQQMPAARLGLAALISVLLALALAALAFWPARAWAPPARPGLNKPIVFDEFFNAPALPSSASAPSAP